MLSIFFASGFLTRIVSAPNVSTARAISFGSRISISKTSVSILLFLKSVTIDVISLNGMSSYSVSKSFPSLHSLRFFSVLLSLLNAVNMTELSEGFSVVASTASSFGVGANELSAALGTMAASTQQSGSEVARAFRAILLNIRQVSDEEEGIDAEGLTKYENACNALNVKLKETKNGVQELRDPMEVLKELSEEYNKLSDTDVKKVNLLNSVGGKLRSTQLDALLRGWKDYEKMLGQFEAGMGSMDKEAAKTAASWEGTWNKVSNTFTDTIGNIANSDAIITLGNALNGILTIVNNLTGALGSLGSIGLGASLIAGIKNVGQGHRVLADIAYPC